MGKVIGSFQNGYPGAIARSLDDVVIALPSHETQDRPIPFGAPVMLDEDGTGLLRMMTEGTTDGRQMAPEKFVGFAVRNPSKTPSAYGASEGQYEVNEMADVLVRGHIVVRLADDSADIGAAVGIAEDGSLTVETGDDIVTLPNVAVSAAPDGNHMAEVVVKTRNLI